MAQRTPQTKANHVRFDPAFHFSLVPALIAMFIWTGIRLALHPSQDAAILFILVILMIALATRSRLYSLKVQDRLIRLEERLRLTALIGAAAERTFDQLTEKQMVALRFASDAEVPALAERAAREKLTGKQIKDAIQIWRPDYFRV